MGTYNEMMGIANKNNTKDRVAYCLKKAAVAVMAEDAGTANHAERVVYAKQVLSGEASVVEATKAVVTNATLTSDGDITDAPDYGISDSDLEFTVNSMFNALAGVST